MLSLQLQFNDYVGTSALHVYAYQFKIFDDDDLEITVRNPTTDVETILTKTTHYTVSQVGNPAGGNVTLVAGSFAWLTTNELTTGWLFFIRRKPAVVQSTSFRNYNYLPAETEDQFDKHTMIMLMLKLMCDRSLHLPSTIDEADFSTDLPTEIETPLGILGVNADGDGFSIYEASDILGFAEERSHAIVAGQSATALSDETFNSALYTSVVLEFELSRGTTIFCNGRLILQFINSAWRLLESYYDGDAHGLTWSLTGTTTAAINVAANAGDNGVLKLKDFKFSA